MKKLNRKGFTLVELLAVIVILALVVGITLATVFPTIKKARQEAFNLSAQTAADYFNKQYELYSLKLGSDVDFSDAQGEDNKQSMADYYAKAKIKEANYITEDETGLKSYWYVKEGTDRVCVVLTNNPVDGEYGDLDAPEAKSDACN